MYNFSLGFGGGPKPCPIRRKPFRRASELHSEAFAGINFVAMFNVPTGKNMAHHTPTSVTVPSLRPSDTVVERSSTPDREPLLKIAAAIVARHRLPFGPVYIALNLFVGVAHAREMSRGQVITAADFGERLLDGCATADDFATIERNRTLQGSSQAQLSLFDM
ncbi:hypothetical protein [Burkholderia ambifaria]|uniref:hypothetical protein n=1 Tax=Burkholderia ambifaria TaxID=152480 RepID=UPI002013B7C6|nr:hypothetical protein [Burkholderia ambifaria]